MTDRPIVAIVATGGTIAMKNDPVTGAPVPALTGADLAAAVPRLSDLARIEVVEFANVPSAYMGPDLWPDLSRAVAALLARPEIAGAIVLHGTDTLDQTAYFLDLTLVSDKPVVMVGAQRNASEADADGARNLLNAVRQIVAQSGRDDLQGLGVTVTLNHNINAAREVRKSHTNNVETFQSGEAGFLGHVDEDRVVFARRSLRRQTLPLPERLARVDLVAMAAGADGRQLRHAVADGAEGWSSPPMASATSTRPCTTRRWKRSLPASSSWWRVKSRTAGRSRSTASRAAAARCERRARSSPTTSRRTRPGFWHCSRCRSPATAKHCRRITTGNVKLPHGHSPWSWFVQTRPAISLISRLRRLSQSCRFGGYAWRTLT